MTTEKIKILGLGALLELPAKGQLIHEITFYEKLDSPKKEQTVFDFTTLKSLIDEQTGINKQVWKKIHPPCFFTK